MKYENQQKVINPKDAREVDAQSGSFSFIKNMVRKAANAIIVASAWSPLVTVTISCLAILSSPFTGPVGIAIGVAGIIGLTSAVVSLAADYVKTRRIKSVERENTLLSICSKYKNDTELILTQHPELQNIVSIQKNDPVSRNTKKPPTRIRKALSTAAYAGIKYILPVAQFITNTVATAGTAAILFVVKHAASATVLAASAAIDTLAKHSAEDICHKLEDQIYSMKQEIGEYNNIHELRQINRNESITRNALEALIQKTTYSEMNEEQRKEEFNKMFDEFDKKTPRIKSPSMFDKIKQVTWDLIDSQDPFSKINDPSKIKIDEIPQKSHVVSPKTHNPLVDNVVARSTAVHIKHQPSYTRSIKTPHHGSPRSR